jgi:hypothetical protein
MGKKQKKEKVVYVDDGRTVADMSGVPSGPRLSNNPYRPPLKAKEVWKTYWSAVKMMFTPMLVVVCGIIIVYMILTFVFMFLV